MSSGSGDSVDDDDEEPQPLKPAQMEAVAVEIDSKLAVVFAAADCCCLDDSPLYCWVKCSMTKHSKMMTMTLFGWRQSAMPDCSAAAGTSTSARRRRRRRADPAAGSTHWRKEALQRLPLMLELKMTKPKMPQMKPQLKWMSPKKKRRTLLLLLLATECPPLSPLKQKKI